MAKEGEDNQRAHVLILPYPAQGHINPMVQFAKRLASKGVRATVATTVYTIGAIRADGINVEPISDGFDQGGFPYASSIPAYLEAFKATGSRTLLELLHKQANLGHPIKCILYDPFLNWAVDVAQQEGIRCAAIFTNSYMACTLYCMAHRGLLPLPISPESTPVTAVPGLPPFSFAELPSFFTSSKYPTYLKMNLDQFSNLDKADWIFANTFQELEANVAEAMSKIFPVQMVGPLVPSAYLDGRIKGDKLYGASLWKPSGEKCLSWLSTKAAGSVVYVSFGSMAELKPNQMEEIAWGLKASNHNFLWVVKESEQPKLPDGYLSSIGEEGLVVSWCNQLEVLAAEAVGCFVTHCGWNSTVEAFSLGVPLVVVPQWADQQTNGKMVEEVWGVGLRAGVDEEGIVGREELGRCVREVMEGERGVEMKRNAEKWREQAIKAVGEGGSSDKNIDAFVEELTG